jgi:hypothetical protein
MECELRGTKSEEETDAVKVQDARVPSGRASCGLESDPGTLSIFPKIPMLVRLEESASEIGLVNIILISGSP